MLSKEAQKVYKKALSLLERRDYTVSKIRTKLSIKFPDASLQAIEEAIEQLLFYQFLDDRRYAQSFIDCYKATYSKKLLGRKLYERGISNDLFEQSYELLCKENMDEDHSLEQLALKKAMALAIRKAERRGHLLQELPIEEKNRLFASLFRKGFSIEMIRNEFLSCQNENSLSG